MALILAAKLPYMERSVSSSAVTECTLFRGQRAVIPPSQALRRPMDVVKLDDEELTTGISCFTDSLCESSYSTSMRQSSLGLSIPREEYAIDVASNTTPASSLQDVCRYVEGVALRPSKTFVRMILGEESNAAGDWVRVSTAEEPKWNHIVWSGQETSGAKTGTMSVFVVEPWEAPDPTLQSFADVQRVRTFAPRPVRKSSLTIKETPIPVEQLIWAKVLESCIQHGTHWFAITNSDYWVFGVLSAGWKVCHVTDPLPRDAPMVVDDLKSPTVLQYLAYWLSSSVGLPGGSEIPVYEEDGDAMPHPLTVPQLRRNENEDDRIPKRRNTETAPDDMMVDARPTKPTLTVNRDLRSVVGGLAGTDRALNVACNLVTSSLNEVAIADPPPSSRSTPDQLIKTEIDAFEFIHVSEDITSQGEGDTPETFLMPFVGNFHYNVFQPGSAEHTALMRHRQQQRRPILDGQPIPAKSLEGYILGFELPNPYKPLHSEKHINLMLDSPNLSQSSILGDGSPTVDAHPVSQEGSLSALLHGNTTGELKEEQSEAIAEQQRRSIRNPEDRRRSWVGTAFGLFSKSSR